MSRSKFHSYYRHHRKLVLIVLGILTFLPLAFIIISFLLVSPYKKYILDQNNPRDTSSKQIPVGLVLGAGINKQGKPYKELQARLDSAAAALKTGYVDSLLLSGDNRYTDYNEPQAMKDYLVENYKIPSEKMRLDYAGRSTYESCERASKVFKLQQTIIFSASSHLPRAIFLCRHFGVEAYGISSNVESNNSWHREMIARPKAVFNVYIYGEKTILDKPK